MTIYSCRAELLQDAELFVKTIKGSLPVDVVQIVNLSMGEVAIEIESTAEIETLREVLRDQIDAHVMLETMRPIPLSENMLERDHNQN